MRMRYSYWQFDGEFRIIPNHIRDEHASHNINVDILESILLQGEKVWDEREGKKMSKKELMDTYMFPSMQKANQTLVNYERGRKSCIWRSWAKQMIYWSED